MSVKVFFIVVLFFATIASSELTLAILKPNLLSNGGRNETMDVIHDNGLKVILSKKHHLNRQSATAFYREHVGKEFFNDLINFITEQEVEFLVLSAPNAIKRWRHLLGPTNPSEAKLTHPNSIRARFGESVTRNAAHGSDSLYSAYREIKLVFPQLSVWLEYFL
ncbi:hypothetical protein GEMRC1_003783 [Eukaryota sp. GEM-RC1]